MEEKVVVDHIIGKAFLPKAKTIVSFNNPKSSVATGQNADGANKLISLPTYTPQSLGYASWGENNNKPQETVALVGQSGVTGTAMLYNILATYGSGVEVGKFVYENNTKVFQPLDITLYPEIDEFFLESDIQDDYLIDCASDLHWFFNFFPYFILNKGRDKINKLYVSEAAYTRYKLRNPKTGVLETVGVCGDWLIPKDIVEIPVLSEFDAVDDLRSRKTGYRFVVPGYFPTPGKSYYMSPYWDAVRANGWIDNTISVPKYIKAVFKNAVNIKYHIRIPDTHWLGKYKDWESKAEDVQLKLIEEELDFMDKFMAGEDNAKKVFFSHFCIDKVTNKEIPGWSIEVIQDYDKDGKYLPESSAGNSEILFAFMVHPDLIGAGTPGGHYGARGSGGSNTREADILKKASLAAYRHRILKPLYQIKRYNNWAPEIQFRIDDTVLTTLDTGSQAIKTITK